ncbi:hypothetical protein DERP_002927 [Dermatophagoides pteronyssinus]|uniref:Uncharacterized protein n=1 Tax=Dermatophagoides pteronyssinus TaxID=6956 RepID=A0ABQ8JW68_DERPT|nr:hypothetical protein DERP_002927 [Dermatophagoides pteronyssinus]
MNKYFLWTSLNIVDMIFTNDYGTFKTKSLMNESIIIMIMMRKGFSEKKIAQYSLAQFDLINSLSCLSIHAVIFVQI